ncbi:MAG TPA: hypothetical protein VKE41_03580 [Roseiflexaceae bacterium]|nr:hypothetical protein [Roseiflexaceae bacterium]
MEFREVAGHSRTGKRLPRGVYVLASLLFLAGGIMLLAAIVLPLQGTNLVPWYVYLAYAAYLLVVGWGLWGARRWAYFAALLMCLVLAFYQLQTAVVLRKNALFPFLGLAVAFGYLIQSKVRAAFLHPAPEEPQRVTRDE